MAEVVRFIELPSKVYNSDLLDEQVKAEVGAGTSGVSWQPKLNKYIAYITDAALPSDEATILSVAAAHDGSLKSETQELLAAEAVARDQIIHYLKQQMTSATPESTATIKATVQAFIDSNVRLQRALTNVAALYSYNTGTNAGYLQAALVLIGWMK